MQHYENTIRSADGSTELYTQRWLPDGEAKAVALLAHGLGEHSGRYQHVAAAFTARGIAVYSLDHQGFGKSGGARGVVPSWDSFHNNMDLVRNEAEAAHPGRKLFLYGHSLGGIIVLHRALIRPQGFSGVISTGAGLIPMLSPFLVFMARTLGGVLPNNVMASGLDVTALSRDQAVVDAYVNDPLVHDKASMGFGKAGFEVADWTLSNAEKLQMPALLMHGSADRITNPEGTKQFYERAGSSDKTLRIYEGYFHEIHNEPEQAEVIATMAEWLLARA